jgi:uncharacterized protein YbjT (DUF2867 family)
MRVEPLGHLAGIFRRRAIFHRGITGKVGGAAARHLLASGKQVRGLVRDPQKAAAWANQGVELVQGDFDDSASLAQALQGVEGAYLMMSPNWNPSPGFPEAKAIVASYEKALAQSPVPKLVVLSSIGSEKSERLGLITATAILERALERLPFPVAFVRAGSFIENFLFALESGKAGVMPSFYQPTDRKVPMIASEDIGAEVAKLLTTELDRQALHRARLAGQPRRGGNSRRRSAWPRGQSTGRPACSVACRARRHGLPQGQHRPLRGDGRQLQLRLDRLRRPRHRKSRRHDHREAGLR